MSTSAGLGNKQAPEELERGEMDDRMLAELESIMNSSVWRVLLVGALGLVGCTKNQPPYQPAAPQGPVRGRVAQEYSFAATATDPEGGMVSVRFDWDDGDTSNWTQLFPSGDTARGQHIWHLPGDYRVSVQARDDKGVVSMWSSWHRIVIADTVNLPPFTPAAPSGPDSGVVGRVYEFAAAAADSNGDRVALQFHWGGGDADTSEWGAWVGSGTRVTRMHMWRDTGEFFIRCRARDEKGAVSDWSVSHLLVVVDSLRQQSKLTTKPRDRGR